MKNNKTSKTSLLAQENRLKDNIEKLPEWAKPIAAMYVERYKEAANQVRILEPDAILKFSQEAREIMEEMTAEINKEAERRGYRYLVTIRKNTANKTAHAAICRGMGSKQSKN